MPAPNPVQPKVKWAAIGVYIGSGLLIAVLEGLRDSGLIAGLPPYVSIFLVPAIPAVISFLVGYRTKNRPS